MGSATQYLLSQLSLAENPSLDELWPSVVPLQAHFIQSHRLGAKCSPQIACSPQVLDDSLSIYGGSMWQGSD